MRFGAPVWPFKWEPPYDDAVRRIAGLGFRAVELIAWNSDSLQNYYTPRTIKDLRSIFDGEGLVLSQFVACPGDNLASADAAERSAAVDYFKRNVDVGLELGTGIINSITHYPFAIEYPPLISRFMTQVFTVKVPAGLNWHQNWLDYVDSIRRCAEYAEAKGAKYSLEMHPFRYAANTEGLLRLIEAVGSPALGANFDPSHTFPMGDVTHVAIYRLADRLWHCDFSDNDGTTNMHFRPGKGKIDWDSAMVALSDIGYDYVVSLEFEDIPGVSRGINPQAGAYKPNVVATPEVDREYRLALQYVTDLAHAAGLKVE
jgi:sugar phosphate isomerase/epimerase